MLRRAFRPLLALPLAIAAGCVEEATIPKVGERPIELTIAVSAPSIRAGEPDTITVTATNYLDANIRLVFPTSCPIRVYIRSATGRLVVPARGVHDCLPIASQLLFPRGGTVTHKVVWTGGDQFVPPGSATLLPPGNYYVTAEMTNDEYSTTAFAVRITLDP